MVAGPPGRSGLCVTVAVDEGIRNARGPAPIQHLLMVVPSVRGRVYRKSPAPHYVQVINQCSHSKCLPPFWTYA